MEKEWVVIIQLLIISILSILDSGQYKHEYNPWHKHSGNFSGVCYLRLPKDMENHLNEETKDHYPASGLIEFDMENFDLRSDTLMFKPEVGMMLVFPSYLKHSVYPFYCDGERRSMSFNAYYDRCTS